MKRFYAALAALIVLSVAACASPSSAPAPAAQAPKTTVKVTIAHEYPPTHNVMPPIEKFKKLVEERSGGRIQVSIHPASELMNAADWNKALSTGTGEGFGIMTTPQLAGYDKAWILPSLPYAINTPDEYVKFARSSLGQEMLGTLKPSNLLGVTYGFFGAGAIFSKKPLKTVADYKGLKIRVSQSPGETAMWQKMGSVISAIPFSEVYTAAQTGVVDAVASGTNVWAGSKFVEVLKYGQNRPMTYGAVWAIVSGRAWWDGLPADVRDTMDKTWKEVLAESDTANLKLRDKEIADAKALGGTWVELTPAEEAPLKQAGMGVWPEFETQIGKQRLDALKDLLGPR